MQEGTQNKELEEGDNAPDFELKSDDGKSYRLSQFKGKKEVVLYFYPKDDTPGCTKEACSFRDSLSMFNKKDVDILGVSNDDLDSHSKFRSKYSLNFPLLADTDHKVSEKYGVFQEKNLYGKKFMGIVRSTFVIDRSGKIKKIFRHVQVDGHAEELLKAV
ncbi:MAG: thioredoxin-dependent thiol peroxidase [Nitrososphaerota archaeon]|nr:thioredoxin-dependent thiol peroxidase [Nitrososphaerota archaeon]